MCFGFQQPRVYDGEAILRTPNTVSNLNVLSMLGVYPIPWLWVSLLALELYAHLILNHDYTSSPFHAGLGIPTCRLLLHLRKFATENLEARGGSPIGSRMTGMVPNIEVALRDPPEITPEDTPGSSLPICV